jgi:hypothetical protein
MRFVALFLFLVCLSFAQANIAAAAKDTNLASMQGIWSGGGFVRPKNFDKKQRVRCKIKVTQKEVKKISLAGRCATASRSNRIALDIIETANGNRVTSIAKISGSKNSFKYLGRRTRSGYVLRIAKPVEMHGRTTTSALNLRLPGPNKLTISEVITDLNSGERIEAVSLTLMK